MDSDGWIKKLREAIEVANGKPQRYTKGSLCYWQFYVHRFTAFFYHVIYVIRLANGDDG